MQKTTPIRNTQRQSNKIKHDGREPQRKLDDKVEVYWTTRDTTTLETTDSKQYMEYTDATVTSASAATDGIQHDTISNDKTANDATTDDADTMVATDGNERYADAPNAIWSTANATTVENDVIVRGGEIFL